MTKTNQLSRRSFVSLVAAAPPLLHAAGKKQLPVGLELYTVRDDLKKDRSATLQAVAKMGYECVEFFAPYYEWSADDVKQVRKQLDDLGMKCYSTHNGSKSFKEDGIEKAIELNKILGAKYIILASSGKISSIDDWKGVADTLNKGDSEMKKAGLHAGYHNHIDEWKAVDGKRPMDVLADNTEKSVVLQLDVGHCVAGGGDPVAWINEHPGRTKSLHLKDWSPDKEFKLLIGEGVVPWQKLFAAAESKGGAEY